VSGVTDAVFIAAGTVHTCAVRRTGEVVCWGDDDSGQLGDGRNNSSPVPVTVTGLSDAVSVAAGTNHTCAVRATGEVVCWGAGYNGQLGDGGLESSNVPVTVTGLSDAVSVATGTYHTCAVRRTGEVVCWGTGQSGQLGNVQSNVPVAVVRLGDIACTTGPACASGFCVDGVCCASACGGGDPNDCQVCSVAAGGSTDGVCTPVPASRVCRASAGTCDSPELCDGVSPDCPPDVLAPSGAVCHAPVDACDVTAACSGAAPACSLPLNDAICSVVPIGSNVTVDLNGGAGVVGGASLTFASVTAPGSAGLISSGYGAPSVTPAFETVGGGLIHYHWLITTTATYTGPMHVCFHYADDPLLAIQPPIELIHVESGVLTLITTSVDTSAKIICGTLPNTGSPSGGGTAVPPAAPAGTGAFRNGAPCAGAADCASSFCVDGVCCGGACGGNNSNDCRACSLAAGGTTDGVCTSRPLVPGCSAPAGAPIGAPCTATSDCAAPGSCTDGYCCDSTCGNSDDNDCQVCAAAKGALKNGTCTMLPSTHLCRPSSGNVCDLGGFCAGGAQCPPNSAASDLTCYTRPAGDQCAAREASIKCGANLTCPAPTDWPANGCGPTDDMNLVTLNDGASPAATVAVQFPNAWPGTISVKHATGCPPATGFTFAPTIDAAGNYWDLDAEPGLTCSFDVTVCITYPQSWFRNVEPTCTNPNDPKCVDPMEQFVQLRHGTSAAQIDDHTCDPVKAGWQYLPRASVDTQKNVVCADTCSLSPFALMIPTSFAQIPLVQPPAPIVTEATSAAGAVVTYVAGAKDLKDGTLVPTCLPASRSVFPVGTTTVKCSVTNSDHLTGTGTFTVTVVDKPPVFSNVPVSPAVAYATSTAGAKVTYKAPTAKDAIDGNAAVKCLPASGGTFVPGKTTVICNAADNHGHAAPPVTFTVWVQYQAPTDGAFFLAPIRASGASIFRIGRPVPVRFKLTGASQGITNLVAKLVVTKISNAVQGTTEDTSDETADDTDLTFKYRAALRFYAYRWKSTNQTQGTYQLRADLGDGVAHQVNVSLKAPR
jgi:hypothetical protein